MVKPLIITLLFLILTIFTPRTQNFRRIRYRRRILVTSISPEFQAIDVNSLVFVAAQHGVLPPTSSEERDLKNFNIPVFEPPTTSQSESDAAAKKHATTESPPNSTTPESEKPKHKPRRHKHRRPKGGRHGPPRHHDRPGHPGNMVPNNLGRPGVPARPAPNPLVGRNPDQNRNQEPEGSFIGDIFSGLFGRSLVKRACEEDALDSEDLQTVQSETIVALNKIIMFVEKAGGHIDDIVQTRNFITDLEDLPEVILGYSVVFRIPPPQVTAEIKDLPDEANIVIDAIALIDYPRNI